MIRCRSLLVALVLVLTVLPATASAAADTIDVREAGTATFPKRSYVVTLPESRALDPEDFTVTENGQPVHDFRLDRGMASSMGVMLAIDASTSMRGQAIRDAMAAARAFARERRPEQKFGVVFFSREASVALAPTTDPETIDRVLSTPPEISPGTEIAAGTKAAVDALKGADVPVGSVVLLSDGCRAAAGECADADAGAAVTVADAARAAEAEKYNVFAVGLRSNTYDEHVLRSLATDGGYFEAARSADLSGIFNRLGRRFGNEYVVSWTSLAPIGARVGVGIEVDGYVGMATAAYQVPDLGPGAPVRQAAEKSFWQSPAAAVGVAGLVAMLVGLAVVLVARGRRRSVGERISSFVFERERLLPYFQHEGPGLLEALDAKLAGRKRWESFKLDVELSRLKPSAIQLAAMTLTVSLGVAAVAALLDRPVIAVIALVGLPIVARYAVRYRADKVRKRFGDQLPDNLQVMASALRAGHSFVGAMKTMVNDAPEPSRSEYQRVLSDEQLGVPIEDSMKVVGERMKNEEVHYVGLIATLQRETGGNTAEVLDRVVATIRERMKLRRLISTLTAQGRLGGWIVTALPIGMVIFLNVVKPEYMDPMLETTIGWVILIVGALMVALGAFVIRKIVDIQV